MLRVFDLATVVRTLNDAFGKGLGEMYLSYIVMSDR